MNTKRLEQYLQEQGIEFLRDIEIGPYITLGIGGKVKTLIIVKDRAVLEALLLLLHPGSSPGITGRSAEPADNCSHSQAYILLGGGSNVVFPDEYVEIPVIINRTHHIVSIPEPGTGNSSKAQLLRVDSGVLNHHLLTWCSEHGAGGMEFLAGIPGTLGGAAAVNAGAFGRSISDILEKADIFTAAGNVETVDAGYFDYEYRSSSFKFGSEVILSVYLRYHGRAAEDIRQEIKSHLQYRRDNHPSYSEQTAGCFFKNPLVEGEKVSAGKLIEQSGLKGFKYKDLVISPQHANFLVNRGKSAFADLTGFAGSIEEKVYRSTGIHLEREVIYISAGGRKY